MSFCIIIPTYNRHKNLHSSVMHNLNIFPKNLSIYVIDSSENTYVSKYDQIKVIKASQRGQFNQKIEAAYKAKNDGFKHVLFLDDDIYLKDDFYDNFCKKYNTLNDQVHAVSLKVENAFYCSSLTNILLNFTRKGGQLLKSTYTSAMNGSNGSVEWAIGGAVLWKLESFLKVKNNFQFTGKAFCEDIFSSSFFGKEGFKYWNDCIVYEDDQSLNYIKKIECFKLGMQEAKSRLILVKRRPDLFDIKFLTIHIFWRILIFLIYGIATFDFTRISYSLGNANGMIRYYLRGINGK